MDEQIRERVEAGAALLDSERPGWDWEIDLGTLDLERCERCVLGQLFGEFGQGVLNLNLGSGQSRALGFDLDDDGSVGWEEREDDTWEPLTDAWKSLILARRQAASNVAL